MSAEHLDVSGQQPGLSNLYTQICLCYTVADASSQSQIISVLRNGLEKLSESFPWIAGEVVQEKSQTGDGIFKIQPLETIPRLVVKDRRDDPSTPTMDVLSKAGFPMSMLDESILSPRTTLPLAPADDDTSPVFLIQATLINGGLLLTFVAQHNVLDMTGQGWVIDSLSRACHQEEFTNEEVSSGNPDRRTTIELLDNSYVPGPELDRQLVKSTLQTTNTQPKLPSEPPKCSWAYFKFDPSSLASLKSLATNTIDPETKFVSTDDALSAFIWQSVIRARLRRLDPTMEVTFARAIDPRRYLGISLTYPGVISNMTYNTYTAQNLIDEPLGRIASQLRLSVDPKTSNIAYRTRALATVQSRAADKNSVSVTASLDLSADIILSSWVKEDFYHLDFNLGLGMPVAVRRPQFTPVESLFYLMPKALDGSIAAALCLRDEDMETLKADAEFRNYAKYIG